MVLVKHVRRIIEITIIALASISLLAWGGTRIVNAITYTQDVSGHLKLAADANSTELAERRLALAIEGMDARGICKNGGDDCFTSVLYRTPQDNAGYWRENIEDTLANLQAMTEEERADNLIESNQLIKVRETLLDSGKNGDHVTDPDGISIYGYNGTFAWWSALSLIALCVPLWSALGQD